MKTTLYKDKGFWSIEVTDNAELLIQHAKKLDGKVTSRITPVKPKNIGRANETTAFEQAELEMASRIKKQIDKGYCRTQEEAANYVSVAPVLATVLEKVTVKDFSSAFLQPKLNGHRCLYRDGKLWSRGGKEIKLPHILEAIKEQGLGKLELDGELYVHGKPLQEIGSLIKRPREESVDVQYWIYDFPSERSFEERYYIRELSLIVNTPLEVTPTIRVKDLGIAKELTRHYEEDGYEGGILRVGTQGYEYGKRSRNLLKLKSYKDFEAKVIGHELAKPNGALLSVRWICENPFGGESFKVLAQGTWEEVHEQAIAADDCIGKTLTLKYFELSSGNVPQQPIALHWKENL